MTEFGRGSCRKAMSLSHQLEGVWVIAVSFASGVRGAARSRMGFLQFQQSGCMAFRYDNRHES